MYLVFEPPASTNTIFFVQYIFLKSTPFFDIKGHSCYSLKSCFQHSFPLQQECEERKKASILKTMKELKEGIDFSYGTLFTPQYET